MLYDLCVGQGSTESLAVRNLLARAAELGYDSVAVQHRSNKPGQQLRQACTSAVDFNAMPSDAVHACTSATDFNAMLSDACHTVGLHAILLGQTLDPCLLQGPCCASADRRPAGSQSCTSRSPEQQAAPAQPCR